MPFGDGGGNSIQNNKTEYLLLLKQGGSSL